MKMLNTMPCFLRSVFVMIQDKDMVRDTKKACTLMKSLKYKADATDRQFHLSNLLFVCTTTALPQGPGPATV